MMCEEEVIQVDFSAGRRADQLPKVPDWEDLGLDLTKLSREELIEVGIARLLATRRVAPKDNPSEPFDREAFDRYSQAYGAVDNELKYRGMQVAREAILDGIHQKRPPVE